MNTNPYDPPSPVDEPPKCGRSNDLQLRQVLIAEVQQMITLSDELVALLERVIRQEQAASDSPDNGSDQLGPSSEVIARAARRRDV